MRRGGRCRHASFSKARSLWRRGLRIRNYRPIGDSQLVITDGQMMLLVSNGFKKHSFHRLLAEKKVGVGFSSSTAMVATFQLNSMRYAPKMVLYQFVCLRIRPIFYNLSKSAVLRVKKAYSDLVDSQVKLGISESIITTSLQPILGLER